jgi:murein DD-endopeptidase MepM/ murein hydrolase activator NlpD
MAGTEPATLSRRQALAAAVGLSTIAAYPARAAAPLPFTLSGRPEQGGALIGRARPGATVAVNGAVVGPASADGLFLVGFDRDEKPEVQISVLDGDAWKSRTLPIRPGVYDVQRIDGLPDAQVTPTAPELLERIAREAKEKQQAFASVDAADGFREGFLVPVAATRISSSFGGQRILNGKPNTPHYGVDLAAPEGTPIVAPAAGLVVLAEPDMHFEGGLTFIDHGQGLVAMFLHQSRLEVKAGDRVTRGQVIGAVGQTGRATGPHLCWRLKWRGRNMNPSLLVGTTAPTARADSLNLFNSA